MASGGAAAAAGFQRQGQHADSLGVAAQVQWDHPNMPWDDTSLWVADVAADGSVTQRRQVRCSELHQIMSTSPDISLSIP